MKRGKEDGKLKGVKAKERKNKRSRREQNIVDDKRDERKGN